MEWFSYTVAVILFISSIVSPIITTLINNYHQLKIKKLNMYEKAKRDALSNFVESAQDYLLNFHSVEQSIKYYSSINKLFIYFSDIDLSTFIPFEIASKESENYNKATYELSKIVQLLSEQIMKE